jgi:hypothetical protein
LSRARQAVQQNQCPHRLQKRTSVILRPHSWQRLKVDMTNPCDGNNAADDILWLSNALQTPCRPIGLAQAPGTTEKTPHDVKYKDYFLAI